MFCCIEIVCLDNLQFCRFYRELKMNIIENQLKFKPARQINPNKHQPQKGPINKYSGKNGVRPLIDVANQLIKNLNIKPEVAKFDKSLFNKFSWVNPAEIFVNFDAQRWPDENHIKKIYKNFNLQKCTPLICVYRTDLGRYHVCDGLQHGSAMLLTFYHCLHHNLEVPVWYAESDSDKLEHELFLCLNNDNLEMAKYFIHKEKVRLGISPAIDIDKMVRRAGAFASYVSTKPGAITHMQHLYSGHKALGEEAMFHAIDCMRDYFPDEKINSSTMLGIAKLFKMLMKANKFDDNIKQEIGYVCSYSFEDANRLQLDIKDEFNKQYKEMAKGIAVMEKVAAGIANVYQQHYGKSLGVDVLDIKIPLIIHK